MHTTPASRLDIIIDADGLVHIHELAAERAETLDLGAVLDVVHCAHSRDGHTECSKGMPLCTDRAACPFAGTI